MLRSLTIHNLVLIDDLQILFHPGMQVLTGETGAGKSIVVDAVNLILGKRADRGLVRYGCEKSSIEALFDISMVPDAQKILEREEIDFDREAVSVWREISTEGRNSCRICGVPVPITLVREIGNSLMDIYGQHEHRFLMDPEMHLGFLDRLGDEAYQVKLGETSEACSRFLQTHREYAQLRRENEQRHFRMDQLEKALKELHEANLKPDEEETLAEEYKRMSNAEKIVEALRKARDTISFSQIDENCLEKIKSASRSLSEAAAFGDDLKIYSDRCESAYYELEEIAYELTRKIESFGFEPERMEKVEERLDLIRRLERKYGSDLKTVLAEQHSMEKEFERLCSLEDRLEQMSQLHKQLLAEYRKKARELSEMRKKLAERFEKGMLEQLRDLGMEKTLFQVRFLESDEGKKPMPRPDGDDRVEFMTSPNPGEPLKPLARIASGGELSRFMLALKTLEAEGNKVPCMVFDEIDTGISGTVAQAVSEKMIAISRSCQVICVTHLPQIAAAADHHFLVKKDTVEGRTVTSLKELDRYGRIQELGRMISGAEGSSREAVKYADAMLEASDRIKKCPLKEGLPFGSSCIQ